MHGAALSARRLPHRYHAARVPAGGLPLLLARPQAARLAGFNLTAPLKEEAAALCAELTRAAALAQAVNTVRVTPRGWLGHNTDIAGLAEVLAARWPGVEPPARAFVLGAGGAARAAVLALGDWGVDRIVVRARPGPGRARLAAWLARVQTGVAARVELTDLVAGGSADQATPDAAAAWVCCLPAAAGSAATPPEGARGLWLDLRYDGPPLPAGGPELRLLDGLAVLLAQGAHAFAWWFGPPAPMAPMHAAVTRAALTRAAARRRGR